MSDDALEGLKKLREEYDTQLADIRQRMVEIEYIPKAKALVGQCFKFPNSNRGYYGFGISHSKRRKVDWIFKRILAADKEYVIVDTFDQEGCGKIEIKFNEREYVTNFMGTRLIPISEKEYFKAFNKLVKFIYETGKKEK